jgi:hypothetical protein
MGIYKRTESRKSWWGLAFGVAGTIGAILTIIFFFLQQRSPSLSFTITSESNIFNFPTSLPDTRVMVQGEDIQRDSLNLKLYTIQILNDGFESIKQGDYDRDQIWGLKINSARIIEARLSGASSENLSDRLRIQKQGDDTVSIAKSILDPGDNAGITLLLLHRRDVEPSFAVIGKIAGIKSIHVEKSGPLKGEKSLSVLFQENWKSVLFTLFIFILLILVSLLFFVVVSGRRKKRRALVAEAELGVKQVPLVEERGLGQTLFARIGRLFTDDIDANGRLLIATLYASSGKRAIVNLVRDLTTIAQNNIQMFQTAGQIQIVPVINWRLKEDDDSRLEPQYRSDPSMDAFRHLVRSNLVRVREDNVVVVSPILSNLVVKFLH